MCIKEVKEGIILEVRVQPKSKKEEIKREGEIIKIRVKSPPERGKANKACIELLAKKIALRKDQIHLIRGEKSHSKVFFISGIKRERLFSLLARRTGFKEPC